VSLPYKWTPPFLRQADAGKVGHTITGDIYFVTCVSSGSGDRIIYLSAEKQITDVVNTYT
jgi:hypothetical protein